MNRVVYLLCFLVWLPAVSLRGQAPAGESSTDLTVRLTLDEAIARGLPASHRVEEAGARRDAGSAAVDQRRAALMPRVGAQAGYMRTNHIDPFGILLPNNQLRVIYPDLPDNYRSRLDAQWPVYTGGRLEALERAARTDASALDHDWSAVRADVRAEIARAYWNLVSAAESIAVLDRALERVEAHLRDARNRLEAGLVSPLDVLSAEAQRARQQMLRIQAASSRDVAEAALARLVALAPGTRIEPASRLDAVVVPPGDFAALWNEARAARPDRLALDARIGAAGQRREAATAGRKPTVGVGAGVDYARPNPRIFPRQGAWRESWDAGVNVEWPLFDGGRAKADVAEASAAQRAAQARLAEFDSLLALEIRRRLSEIAASQAAIGAADAAMRAATEASRVAGDRFSAGVATTTDVLDAQLTILQASLERAQAAVSLRIAEADLARAVGRQGP